MGRTTHSTSSRRPSIVVPSEVYYQPTLTCRWSGITGPVVLVGASIGGFSVRVFASEHGARTVGLVLVDASHEDQILAESGHAVPIVQPEVVVDAIRAIVDMVRGGDVSPCESRFDSGDAAEAR